MDDDWDRWIGVELWLWICDLEGLESNEVLGSNEVIDSNGSDGRRGNIFVMWVLGMGLSFITIGIEWDFWVSWVLLYHLRFE